jgi:hypothetical protein
MAQSQRAVAWRNRSMAQPTRGWCNRKFSTAVIAATIGSDPY